MSRAFPVDPLDLEVIAKRAEEVAEWDGLNPFQVHIYDLACFDVPALLAEIERLREGIRQHRQYHVDRWLNGQDDDKRLWALLDRVGDAPVTR